jgi:hypothetical protein
MQRIEVPAQPQKNKIQKGAPIIGTPFVFCADSTLFKNESVHGNNRQFSNDQCAEVAHISAIAANVNSTAGVSVVLPRSAPVAGTRAGSR